MKAPKILIPALIALVGATSLSATDPIPSLGTMNFINSGVRGTSGGEFGIDIHGYGVDGTDLLSFCLEVQENLSFGPTYSFELDTAARLGGGNHLNESDSDGTFDTLSKGSEFLYDLFYRGESGEDIGAINFTYDHDNSSGNNQADSKALQLAFWVLEDEKSLRNDGGLRSIAGNKYLGLVNTEFGGIAGAKSNFMDWDNSIVRVMNIWDGNVLKQSQIVAAVPESGLVLLMLSGVLGFVGYVKRRRLANATA